MNYFKNIISYIKDYEEVNIKHSSELAILRHLISMMGEKSFNINVGWYVDKTYSDFDDWYYNFHKSMRQVDFFEMGEGHLDMVFWHFIHISEIPYKLLKKFFNSGFESSPYNELTL